MVKRYSLKGGCCDIECSCYSDMEDDPLGDYVEFSDVMSIMKKLWPYLEEEKGLCITPGYAEAISMVEGFIGQEKRDGK